MKSYIAFCEDLVTEVIKKMEDWDDDGAYNMLITYPVYDDAFIEEMMKDED
jgi:hypothetical protein